MNYTLTLKDKSFRLKAISLFKEHFKISIQEAKENIDSLREFQLHPTLFELNDSDLPKFKEIFNLTEDKVEDNFYNWEDESVFVEDHELSEAEFWYDGLTDIEKSYVDKLVKVKGSYPGPACAC